jgi:iron(III) transport system permease protein
LYRQPLTRSPLSLLAVAVATAVLAPLAALLVVALQPSGADALVHLVSTVLPRYTLTSLALVLLVGVFVLLLGVGAGWLVAAFEFPGRRLLEVGMILPLAIPAFVIAYAYTDFLDTSGPLQAWLRTVTGWRIGEYWFPQVRSLGGAAVFLSLALYPYVYMLARNAFAERSESLADAARSLGLPRHVVWWRVTWPVARPAVVAGVTLVMMETLADFGTVSFFAVDTFSAGIYRAWQGLGDRTAAARLSIALLGAVLLLVWLERRQRGRMAFHSRSSRPARPRRLHGFAAAAAFAACFTPVAFGFLLPALLLVRAWQAEGGALDARLWGWASNTAILSGLAVAVIVPLALGLAYAVRSVAARWMSTLAAVAGTGYAVPGIVLGVGLLAVIGAIDRVAAFATGGTGGMLLGGTAVAVVYAYCVRFLAVAQHGLDASLKRISPSMDASARTLGAGQMEVLTRVHWPLLKPSLATAALLVFVDCLKELPATLVLRPFNFDTLAVVAYNFASDERLGEAALPSLVIVLVGLVPVTILARSFRRH